MRLVEIIDQEPTNLRFVEPDDDKIPPYAVLSHTWGTEGEEYLYRDFIDGTSKDKPGYWKIQFCATQAVHHDLRYIWVDTCCIDKSSSTELSEAINSMFRWYKNAACCYVYLSDVMFDVASPTAPHQQEKVGASLMRSRWFTRGWTLQELIAPLSVEFFAANGEMIGNKSTFERQIHERTGIPVSVLRGAALDSIDVEQRLAWARDRETKRREDKVYSLLGIFGIYMPLLYGEGRESAFTRLRKEIDAKTALDLDVAKSATSADQSRAWNPRYYFFYGWHSGQGTIARTLGLSEPPVVHRAFIRGCSVAHLGRWKVLLDGPADGRAEGVAYKVESEWHESKLILEETDEYVPGPCLISILTGDGWFATEGRAFKYCGPEFGLEGVLPGAKPFNNDFCGYDCSVNKAST